MKRLAVIPLMAALLLLACSKSNDINKGSGGCTATIFEENGKKPAAGAMVTIFEAGSAGDKPVLICITDDRGRYSLDNLPDGYYTVFAEKDSFVLLQDSVALSARHGNLKSDTLERPSSVTGIVGVEPLSEPNTVTIRLLGTGKTFDVLDKEGRFTLTGLAAGRCLLLLSSRLPGYLPTVKELIVAPHSSNTIDDTLRLSYNGIPIVSGIRITQNIFTGTISISWNKATCSDFKDYVIYQDSCGAIDLLPEPIHSSVEPFFIDSTFVRLFADVFDTLPRCLKYRVAVRTIAQATGLTNGYTEMQFMPKVFVWTFFNHNVRYRGKPVNVVSIDDTIVYSFSAKNRTRPLRRLTWWDPKKNLFIPAKVTDSTKKEMTDSIRYAFHDTGDHYLCATVIDSAGTEWPDKVFLRTIIDTLAAQAGRDTGVFVGEKVHLHGNAVHFFGDIPQWRWKIGDGEWETISGPDTVFSSPLTEKAVECNLRITDEDGTTKLDTMYFFTSVKAQSIAAGNYHSLILKTDGNLWACGHNGYGQLCNGLIVGSERPVHIAAGVRSMAAGGWHTLFLLTNGDLWVCGNNDAGQFGDGTTEGRLTPKQLMSGVQSIAAGEVMSLILKTDSTLWICGGNQSPDVAGPTVGNRYMPMLVATKVRDMAVGDRHILFLKNDRTLWACGENDYGQLGDTTWENRSLPVRIMDNVQTMAAGDKFSLIVKTDGTLWACGRNDKGQFGDGTTANRPMPVKIMNNVQSVAAGSSHSLILKTDNTLLASGQNVKGQLGDGTSHIQYTAVKIMSNVKSIAAGREHSLILKNDGTVWACGDDTFGQLGNGTGTTRPSPVRMIPYHYYPR